MTERDFAFFYLNVLTVKVNVTLTFIHSQLTAERFSCEHDECSHPVLGIPIIHLFALVVFCYNKKNQLQNELLGSQLPQQRSAQKVIPAIFRFTEMRIFHLEIRKHKTALKESRKRAMP